MIPPVNSPKITEIDNADSRLKIRDNALEREIKELNAMKSQGSPQDIDNRESLIAMVLANPDKDFTSENDVDARLKTAWLNRGAINEARQTLKQKRAKAKYEAGTAILSSPEVQRAHAELMQRIVSPLVEVSKAWVELFGLAGELRDREIGFRCGICELMPLDLLGAPNAYSPLAQYLHSAVEAGFVKASSLPKELRVR